MSAAQELVVYGGKRASVPGKLVQVFYRFADDGELSGRSYTFHKVENPVIGASYHVDLDTASNVTIKRQPPRVADLAVTEAVRDAWWVEQRAALDQNRIRRAEKALADRTPVSVQTAINALINLARTLDHGDLRPLVNYIVEQAWRQSRRGYKAEPVKTRKKTKKRKK